nr:hypothetical protein [Streptomyces sp. DSM 41633]
MTEPVLPEDSDRAPFHRPSTDSEQAHETVMRVIEAYNTRLVRARHSPGRETAEVVAGWRENRDRAVEDADRLADAGPDETARIAMAYAALLSELRKGP